MTRARRGARMGNVLDDAYGVASDAVDVVKEGAEAVADVATSAVDWVSDAGKTIGSVLKFVAPIVALWPGIGTAVSIALSAAAAYACGDEIEDAIVDIAAAAMPGGVPRAAFTTAADVTRAAFEGGNVKEAAIRGMRATAQQVGGERAVAAFDAGLAVARGAKIQDATWKLARAQAAQGGTAELVAFDAAVAVANGGGAEDVAIAIFRDYAIAAGGPLAAAAFDGGLAIARGKSLQDAGFASLKAFAAGNDLAERALNFADKAARAIRRGESVEKVVVEEFEEDIARYGAALARSGAGESAKQLVADQLGPVLDRWTPAWADLGSYELGELLGVAEEIARAAQAIMRDGSRDEALEERLTKTGVQSAIEKYGAAVVVSKAVNESYVDTRAGIRADQLELLARLPSKTLSYATAKAEQAPPPPPVVAAPLVVDEPSVPPSPRHSAAGDIALGGVVAAAAVALFWWAKS